MASILTSVRRGLARIALLATIGAALLTSSNVVPLLLGPTLAPLAFGFGLCFLALAVGDLALRILQPAVDPQAAAREAMHLRSTGAGLVYLGRCILAAVVLMLIVTAPRAGPVHADPTDPLAPPAAAVPLLPLLQAEQRAWWPDHPRPSALGGQVEQETCPSLTHRKCWSPRAELRTSRERGVGLGQITRTARFDALAELRAQYPRQLAGWSWDDATLYDARLQLRALVLMDLRNWRALRDVPAALERLAMALAAYSGGQGGLASDRRACAATPGCDPARWWGHVEHTSLKAKTAVAGYGKSWFAINREYPRNIIHVRRVRYLVLES